MARHHAILHFLTTLLDDILHYVYHQHYIRFAWVAYLCYIIIILYAQLYFITGCITALLNGFTTLHLPLP